MDAIEKAEAVEAELDAFISRRARQNRAEREREVMYEASVRRDRERRQEENRRAWRSHHLLLAGNHAALCNRHRARAAELSEGGDAMV